MWIQAIARLRTHVKMSLVGSTLLALTGCSSLSRAPSLPTTPTTTAKPITPQAQPATAHKTPIKKIPTKTANAVSAMDNPDTTQPQTTLEKVAWCASKQQGKLYCWGGSSPTTGFDCSGLTQYSFRQGAGVHLPRTAAAQYAASTKIAPTAARRGDLVFFRTRGNNVSHVGIYLGGERFIHAPRTGKAITISKLSGYWQKRLVGFGRIPGACRPLYS